MAGPHVAGLVALIISANPSLSGDVAADRADHPPERQAADLATEPVAATPHTEVPNNEFGWGRIDALAAVQMALDTGPTIPEGDRDRRSRSTPRTTCRSRASWSAQPGGVPALSARTSPTSPTCASFVGTDLEFQSRADADGVVHDYVFVGTMGAGTRIYDVTDPRLPRFVGGYTDPGWQNDVTLFGDTHDRCL